MQVELQGFTQSLLSTKGLLDESEPFGWTDAMVDALLFDTFSNAARDGKDPLEYLSYLINMIQERSEDWISVEN